MNFLKCMVVFLLNKIKLEIAGIKEVATGKRISGQQILPDFINTQEYSYSERTNLKT